MLAPVTALRLQVLDRWPLAAARPLLWSGFGIGQAFDLRWNSEDLPTDVSRWYRRFDQLPDSAQVRRFRSARSRRLTKPFDQLRPDKRFANVGLGARHKNSLHVAIAIDSYLDGAPATALPWPYDSDPVVEVAVESAVSSASAPTIAIDETQARQIVASWGAGSKGIISVRDPGHPTHRVFTVLAPTDAADDVRFFDYSRAMVVSWSGRCTVAASPEETALRHLGSIDTQSGFASIRLWQTSRLPDHNQLSPGLFQGSAQDARDQIELQLPPEMPTSARTHAFRRLWFFGDHDYAHWLLNQIDRGACTFDPGDLATLCRNPDELTALTRLDGALVALARAASASMSGATIELTVTDSEMVRRHLGCFDSDTSRRDSLVVRSGAIDGLATGTIEIWIGPQALNRVGISPANYHPPVNNGSPNSLGDQNHADGALAESPSRRLCWIDANRGAGDGSRKTNCWNTAAAIANYLATGAPSTSLPIYRTAPLRPTIPEYLSMLGVRNSPRFVTDRQEADDEVAGWPPNTHGVVLAAWSAMSTHVFNVVFDGITIRYLDGHTAEDGDFNFDVRWERIGIVAVGPLHPGFCAEQSAGELPECVVGDLRVGLA